MCCLSSVNATICILTHTAIVEYVARSLSERKHLDRISESRGGEAWAMLMGLHVNLEVTAFFSRVG